MDKTVFGSAITETFLAATYPDMARDLGSIRVTFDPTWGRREWVFIHNSEAATAYPAGTVVMNKAATTTPGQTSICATSTASHRVVGVAVHNIPAVTYGWIQRKGIALVLADTGGFTTDLGLIPGNAVAGRADDRGAAVDAIFATALATTLATATGLAYLNCPASG